MKIHKLYLKLHRIITVLVLGVFVQVGFALEVSPEGDFVMNGTTLELYVGSGGDVVIPSEIGGVTVKKIEELAFLMAPVTSVVVPSSVERIEGWAFYDCNQMTHLTLEEGVETIGEVAFYYCESLVEVNLPESLTEIEDEAFGYCLSLESIVLPSTNLKTLGYGVFHACESLREIVIPNSVTSLGDWAFYNCGSLVNVTLSSRVTKIDKGTFSKCTSLTEVYLPEGVRTVDNLAFLGCLNLKQVFFPSTIRTIGDFVFADTENIISLEEVEEEIPDFAVVLWGYAETTVEEYGLEHGQLFLEMPQTREVLRFEDVGAEDWYLAGVTYVGNYGMISGEEGYYYPSEGASRAVTAGAFAVRSGEELSAGDVTFEDVSEFDMDVVSWCVSSGVMSGYSETEFGALDFLTREQFATVLASFARYQERYQESLEGEGRLVEFYDVWEISDYAVGAMGWAVGNGLLVGYEGELAPKRVVTRAEVAVVMLAYERMFL